MMPFTWSKLTSMHGTLAEPEKRRIRAAISNPTARTWARARTIIVAGNLSGLGQTLWQCVEAITLTRYPDGEVPRSEEIIRALCYATGEPYRRSA